MPKTGKFPIRQVFLPESLYQKLARKTLQGQVANIGARVPQEQEREGVQKEFASWIKANAGTRLDLDPSLETAGIENMLDNTTWNQDETR